MTQAYQILKVELPKIEQDRRFKPNSAQKLAAIQGLVHFQGTPCNKGHSGLRYTKSVQCIECMGLAKGKAINPRQRSNKNHELSIKAANEGKVTYIPNKPCKYGHLLRFINSNNCVECDKFQAQKHKINAKFSRIKKLYNLSKEEYLQLVKNQNSSCKLCNDKINNHFNLHVDHCHDTNKVRGLLCSKCNQGIGLLNHNPELIRKAALYCEGT